VSLALILPTLAPSEWCHQECYALWSKLEPETQGLLGGHIHFDTEKRSWSVPSGGVPTRSTGLILSDAGVIRRDV